MRLEASLGCLPICVSLQRLQLSLLLHAKYQRTVLLERGEQGKGVHRGLGQRVELEAKQKGGSDAWVMLFVRLSQLLSAKCKWA